MKHHLEWKKSRLDIRCWVCSEILISISTNGSTIRFDALADSLELSCPKCRETCEYDLYESDLGSFLKSHSWDSDVDLGDFEGEIGEKNRSLLRQYKTILLGDESTTRFFRNEFHIVHQYLETLSVSGIDASAKDDHIIDQYLEDYRELEGLSKSRETLIRRAINRFYRLRKSCGSAPLDQSH
jgi:hypothetical protein